MDLKTKINKIVKELEPTLEEGENEHMAYSVLIASAMVGPNIKRISSELSMPRRIVSKMSRNLRNNGVWVGGKVCCDWLGKNGVTSIALDVCVALGLLERK